MEFEGYCKKHDMNWAGGCPQCHLEAFWGREVPEEITYEELETLDLTEAGWKLDDNGFWYHPHHNKHGGYTTEHALEILALETRIVQQEECITQISLSRDALTETIKSCRWKDGEAGVTYITASSPPFLFHPTEVASFKELIDVLKAVFDELKDKDIETGTLVYSLVRKKFDKIKLPDENEVQITEYFINTLFQWNGKQWVNIFGHIHL